MDLGCDLYWYIKDIGISCVIVKKISSTLINIDCADTTIQEQTGFLTTDFMEPSCDAHLWKFDRF